MPRLALRIRRALLATGLALFLSSTSSAGLIVDQLGMAGPGRWAVLGLGGTTVDATDVSITGPGTTNGNVGVASSGKLSLSSSTPPAIRGNVFLGNTATINGNISQQIVGTVLYNQDTLLDQAVADAINAASYFNGLVNTFSVAGGKIDSTMTLTATQAVNVAHITDLNLNHENLTLVGTAGQQFIINVSGDFKISAANDGTGRILLAGGLTAADVIFNITGTGSDIATSGGSSGDLPNTQIHGIILSLQRKIAFAPAMVYGEIIGGGASISLVSGSEVRGLPQFDTYAPVPEPASFALFLPCTLMVLLFARHGDSGAVAGSN